MVGEMEISGRKVLRCWMQILSPHASAETWILSSLFETRNVYVSFGQYLTRRDIIIGSHG